MAAAAPKVLASDSLEVTRSSHLLSLQNPTPHTKKALTASSILLAARAEKKAARQAKGGKRAVEFDGEGLGEEEGMESDSEGDSELDVADALREADMGEMDVEDEEEVKEKIKNKVKVGKQRSALRKTGGGGMGMGMQVDA
jgi:large subunit ribosomal protein L24e